MIEFNIELLLETYADLLKGPYRAALENLIAEGSDFAPPSLDVSDASINDSARHVQECSDHYAKMSLICAYARSAQKLAEGQYKHTFRKALLEAKGSNKESREAEAAGVASEYQDQLLFFESALSLFTSLEQSARVNADSSRKIAELIHSQRITEAGNKYT